MRILIISQYFMPDITAAAFRIGETADILARNGHALSVICAKPHKSSVNVTDEESTYPVKRIGIRPLNGGGLVNYLLHYFSFVAGAMASGFSVARRFRPDVVWATSPPLFVGIAGVFLARVTGAPLVLDIRDIWPESAAGAGQISEKGLAFRFGRVLERWLYRRAAAITCVSAPMARYLAEASQRPVTVIYNGARRSALGEASTTDAGPTGKTLVYAGNLGHAQGLETLLSAFDTVASTEAGAGWTLELIGSGALDPQLRSQAAAARNGERIHFLGTLPKPETLKRMSRSGMLFLNLNDDPVFELTIPSKVFDYMLAARPIVAGLKGEGAEILARTGGNILFAPSDHADLCRALDEAFQRCEELSSLARANRSVSLENYSREQAVVSLQQLFQSLITENRP